MHNRDENKLTQINLIKKSEVGIGNRKNNFNIPWPGKGESWIGAEHFAICSGPKVA
jgi:hypothetical protein